MTTDTDIREALRHVVDPEIGVNIVDLGLVSMACGMWLGLVRLGWNLPLPWQDQLIAHGPRPTRTVRFAFVLAMVTILAGVAAATCGRSLASARSAWGSLR